jgi:hypothetical protein
MFEFIILMILVFVSWYLHRIDQESIYLKNLNVFVGTAAVLVAGHFSYIELIQKKKDKDSLPPVLVIESSLQKVAESDSCYWLKATIHYKNKSNRRIYVLSNSFEVSCFNIIEKDTIYPDMSVETGQEFQLSDKFQYLINYKTFYAHTSDSETWLDENDEEDQEYIIKVPNEYQVASFVNNVLKSNKSLSEMPEFRLKKDLKDLVFVDSLQLNERKNSKDDSLKINKLKYQYGISYSFGTSQLCLK